MDGTAMASERARPRPSDGAGPVAPLPVGSIVLHIGPHKTGTSSVQSAFHAARPRLAEHAVRYAGPNRHPVRAAQAVIAAETTAGKAIRPWTNLVGDVRGHPSHRIVLSSEWFADARPDGIRRIVGDLGADRVHVVVTVRALVRVLPSQWQQHVQAGATDPLEPWLERVLGDPPAEAAAGFWWRHRHDDLVRRWAEVVGRDRVTVVVVDDVDHQAVLRAFEGLLGLPPGILVPEPARRNRSLTRSEIELVRATNLALSDLPIDRIVRRNLVLYGLSAGLREGPARPHEPPVELPAWAIERANHVARDIASSLATSGVEIAGDLDRLVVQGNGRSARPADDRDRTADAASRTAAGALGILAAAGLARSGGPDSSDVISTSRLGEVLIGRLRGAGLGSLGALRRRPRVAAHGRPLALTERRIVDTLAEAMDHAGVAKGVRDEVIRGATAAIREQSPDASAQDLETTGAAVLAGLVRSTGLVDPPRGPSWLARVVLAERRRLTGETLELARLSTPGLVRLLSGRAWRRAVLRGSP